jgi:hypothetical protein
MTLSHFGLIIRYSTAEIIFFSELDRLHRELQSQTNENARLMKQQKSLQSDVISPREQNSSAPLGTSLAAMLYLRCACFLLLNSLQSRRKDSC